MTTAIQLELDDNRLPNCPFLELIEPQDNRCRKNFHDYRGYDVLSCDDTRLPQWLEEVRGPGFNDVAGTTPRGIHLPIFIPALRHGSAYLVDNFPLKYAAVSLEDLYKNRPSNKTTLKRWLGVPSNTKVILLGFAHDAVIETNIWSIRHEIYRWIANLGFDLITSLDYSIWDDQPHAERLINAKRNLLTFEELYKLGLPTIPHVYWYGPKDIARLAKWLNANTGITTAVINLQTAGSVTIWNKAVVEIRLLGRALTRPVHFIVNGPSRISRISDIAEALPSFTIITGSLSRESGFGNKLTENGSYVPSGNANKHNVFTQNIRRMIKNISMIKRSEIN